MFVKHLRNDETKISVIRIARNVESAKYESRAVQSFAPRGTAYTSGKLGKKDGSGRLVASFSSTYIA